VSEAADTRLGAATPLRAGPGGGRPAAGVLTTSPGTGSAGGRWRDPRTWRWLAPWQKPSLHAILHAWARCPGRGTAAAPAAPGGPTCAAPRLPGAKHGRRSGDFPRAVNSLGATGTGPRRTRLRPAPPRPALPLGLPQLPPGGREAPNLPESCLPPGGGRSGAAGEVALSPPVLSGSPAGLVLSLRASASSGRGDVEECVCLCVKMDGFFRHHVLARTAA